MREDELDVTTFTKSPAIIYQCYCLDATKEQKPLQSKDKNHPSIIYWLFTGKKQKKTDFQESSSPKQ